MTAAEIVSLDTAAAKRLDGRIRLLVNTINDNIAKLHDLVDQAKRGDVHQVLGYRSWTEYLADVFTVQVRLDREKRRELVGYLSGEGVPQRVIADVVGADRKTVRRDIEAGEKGPPEPDPIVDELISQGVIADVDEYTAIMAMADVPGDDDFEKVLADARAEGDLSQENVVSKCRELTPVSVTGRDGKSYPARAEIKKKAKPDAPKAKDMRPDVIVKPVATTRPTDAVLADLDRITAEMNAIHAELDAAWQSWLWPGDTTGKQDLWDVIDPRRVPKGLTKIELPKAPNRGWDPGCSAFRAAYDDISESIGDINVAIQSRDAYAALTPQEKRALTARNA